MQQRPRIPARSVVGLCFVSLLLMACASDPLGSGRRLFEISLVAISGDEQELPSGGVESAPLVVRVVDQHGAPYPDQTIEWRLVQGGGTLSAASSRTDASGHARITYSSGPEAGVAEVTATVSFSTGGGPTAGRPVPPVRFMLNVTSASASSSVDDA
jgi:hypothetical protein